MITDLKDFYRTMTYFSIEQKETAIALVESMERTPEGLQDLIRLLDRWIANSSEGIIRDKFIEIRNRYLAKITITECMEEINV